MKIENFIKTPVWYPILAGNTFLTSFVKLKKEAIEALANGEESGEENSHVADAINDLRNTMTVIKGNSFVSVDSCSPTDTERFLNKRGAVYSPESAWKNLAQSDKVRQSAKDGNVEFLCIRPFRRMNKTREFRLFIYDGKLSAMSQYFLIRHFRRLEGIKENFWTKAEEFIDSISWRFPVKNLVIDVYFTSANEILIIDLNMWGAPTDPLLLNTWDRNWEECSKITLMPAPIAISGDVKMSF